MRSRRPGGGGEGGRDGRDVSPKTPTNAKIRDRRSDWHPRSSRGSLSSPSRSRRSISVERRDYASRRSNHGKQHRSRSSPFEDKRYELPPKYILPDVPRDSSPDPNACLKPPRIIKDKDFLRQSSGAPAPASSSGLDELLQKSVFLNDGSAHSYFSLPPDANYSAGAAALKSENMGRSSGGGNMNMGIRDDELLHYRDRMRNPYNEREREKIYFTRDFTLPVMPPSQHRPYGGASSSDFVKDDLSVLYADRHHQQLSDGYVGGGMKKFLDDPFDRTVYSPGQLTEPVRRVHHSPPARDEPQDYGYHELWRRERSDHGLLPSDDICKKISWGPRPDYRDSLSSSFMNLTGGRVEGLDASRKIRSESSFWGQHHSFHGDAAPEYRELKGAHEDYASGLGGGHLELGIKPLRGCNLSSFEEHYALGRDAASMGYRERMKNPVFSDHRVDIYRQGMSPPRGNPCMGDLDVYDLSSEGMIRRRYVMDNDVKETEPRSIVANDRNAFRRIPSPIGGDEIWPTEDRIGFAPKKNMAFERSLYRMTSRRMSRSAAQLPWDDSSHCGDGGHGMSLKRRLRPGPSEFHDSFPSERRQEIFRSYKYWKKGMEDRRSGPNTHDGAVPDDDVHLVKADPPQDSEEFKQQVHKAFLKYSKSLHENAHQKKGYREQGNRLRCCVCCSCLKESKEFGDTHSLVTHAYHSRKVGLRTEHLGLHKALCFLMGWNWLVAPDNSRLYQSRPVAEAKALKEDLILWPPIVIIHKTSVGIKVNTHEPKAMTNEGIEERLKEMGFGAGVTNVYCGKPGDQSVLLVKYKPTLSGLQESERLHKHFHGTNHGRQEFLQITANKSSSESGEATLQKVEELLYGYMAVLEDMDKLDPETKKRCVIKSKKDIEAIADAPLNAD